MENLRLGTFFWLQRVEPNICILAEEKGFWGRKRIDFPEGEVTVSVDEETGKSVLLTGRIRHVCAGFLGSANATGSLPTSHCLDKTYRVG